MSAPLAPEAFRNSPVGWWSTAEILPYGEAIGFYPTGIGVHIHYCGLGGTETYFEWQAAGDYQIRVRVSSECDEGVEPDPKSESWEIARYSVAEGLLYNSPSLHLRTMFGPVLALEELWYQGDLRDGPTSAWQPPGHVSRSRTNAPHHQTICTDRLIRSICTHGAVGTITGLWLALQLKNPVPIIVASAVGLVSGVVFGLKVEK